MREGSLWLLRFDISLWLDSGVVVIRKVIDKQGSRSRSSCASASSLPWRSRHVLFQVSNDSSICFFLGLKKRDAGLQFGNLLFFGLNREAGNIATFDDTLSS